MRYLVVKKEHGGGCDYTIGCGMRYDWIEADSYPELIEKVTFPDGRDEQSAMEAITPCRKYW